MDRIYTKFLEFYHDESLHYFENNMKGYCHHIYHYDGVKNHPVLELLKYE